jgi:hypothetical protein
MKKIYGYHPASLGTLNLIRPPYAAELIFGFSSYSFRSRPAPLTELRTKGSYP